MLSQLRLVPRDRLIEEMERGEQTPRRFLDSEVDGRSLYDTFADLGMDVVSPLWLEPTAQGESENAVARLLARAPSELLGGRVALFVCPECGDLGCGAVTVQLVIERDRVKWRDWGYQTDYDQTIDRSDFDGLPVLEFDASAYERELRNWQGRGR